MDVPNAAPGGYDDADAVLLHDDVQEEITPAHDADGDAPMESDDDDAGAQHGRRTEIQLQNDSAAHFDGHKDSIFCIAQHPVHPTIVATGGGDDVAHVFDVAAALSPSKAALAAAALSAGGSQTPRASLRSQHTLDGHTDSVTALAFTLPDGEFLVTAGLDGRLRAWQGSPSGAPAAGARPQQWRFVGDAHEVREINWVAASPHAAHANYVALGASDGSVWVYRVDGAAGLELAATAALHVGSCTAGAWTPDGALLATISDDASLYVLDVFHEAAASGLVTHGAGAPGGVAVAHVVGLTADDARFRVDGGLYSVAVAPSGALVAVGGNAGQVRVVGLPRLGAAAAAGTTAAGGGGAHSKPGGAKQRGAPKGGAAAGSAATLGQAGQLLASVQAGSDCVESLAFARAPLALLAAANVDGSITLLDTAHRFSVRRVLAGAHAGPDDDADDGAMADHAVVKVDFVPSAPPAAAAAAAAAAADARPWLLTSCGYDGVLRRWDTRGTSNAQDRGLVGEWRGHRGGGEGGGILDFVQGDGSFVVTAGDE